MKMQAPLHSNAVTPTFHASRHPKGSTLLMVMGFILVISLTLASVMSWAGAETVLVSRRASQINSLYGADSAVSRSMAQVRSLYFGTFSTNSYLSGSLAAPTDPQLSSLSTPSTVSALNNAFTFSNVSVAYTTGTASNRYTSYAIPITDENLTAYAGLTSQRATIQCSAKAINKNARFSVPSQVRQSFNIDYIPAFQYAVFFNQDMEVFNGPALTINGKVHVNGTLYYAPASTLTITSSAGNPSGLTTSGDIELGLKVWDSSIPTALSSAAAGVQTMYNDMAAAYNAASVAAGGPAVVTTGQALYAGDPHNWVHSPPSGSFLSSGYGTASFNVKNASTGSLVDFRTSTSPTTYFDSTSSGWSGGAVSKWGGAVKSAAQGISNLSPPVPSDLLSATADPVNPYHVMVEHPVVSGIAGTSTESTSVKGAKAGYEASLMIERNTSNIVFRLRGTDGNFHQVNNLNNAANIVPNTGSGAGYNPDHTTVFRDNREYLQNSSHKMSVTEVNVGAIYGNSSTSTTAGAIGTAGAFIDNTGSHNPITTDAAGTTFTPVPFDGTVYVYDSDFSSTRKPAVRIKNAATIYDNDRNSSTANTGITIMSDNPVYVQGNFNADGNTSTGPEKTGGSKENVPPAMIAADVVNVLSTGWVATDDDPSSSASTYFGRQHAGDTEINAAILAGVNPSSQSVSSSSVDGSTGGLNNFPHFQENWNGSTFKYSGSLVALWYSKQATASYYSAGTTYGVFSAPVRDWAFNTDFLNPNNLPRLTPIIRVYTTTCWSNY